MTNNRDSATKRRILEIATEEFSELGLAGARVERIGERAGIAKRMIYYHFRGKEDLYLAVLRQVYEHFRQQEANLSLTDLSPRDAMVSLIQHTYDIHQNHPDYVRIVAIEDIHDAEFLKQLHDIHDLNNPIIDSLSAILKKGQAEGSFRKDIDAFEVHLIMSSLCFFRVAHRGTFSVSFDRDLNSPELTARCRDLFVDVVMNHLTLPKA